MPVDAIGATLDTPNTTTANSAVSQDDFIKLFLAQLSFQDPLEPVNNEQFLAQMAQFANLEQSRQIYETLQQQTTIKSSEQALTMLGRAVEVTTDTGNLLGTVSAVSFNQGGASMTITKADNSFISNIRISQVRLITN